MQTAPVTPIEPVRAVDMTTPWSSLVDTLVCMIENSAVGRANAVAMLRKMAADADEAVAARKAGEGN